VGVSVQPPALRAPAKTPIGLIDGAKLIEIMAEQEIGVNEKKFLALQLHRDRLTLEYLAAESSGT
jgi:restriction endonuclease Mrr